MVIDSGDEINGGIKFLRLNFIKDITKNSKTFKKRKDIKEYIYNFQSLMSRFDKKPFEVVVRVDYEVARFFEKKKFLKSQLKIGDDGKGIRFKYVINNDEEILFLAKRWLPHMVIVSPKELNDKLVNMAEKFLRKCDEI